MFSRPFSRRSATTAVLGILAALPFHVSNAAPIFGPLPYLGVADSPFAGLTDLVVEDFEDGYANTAGMIFDAIQVLAPGPLTDSVDEDDGAIDGFGTGGHSLYSNGRNAISILFDALVLGRLPTHAGIVWTDVGDVTAATAGYGDVVFEAFDATDTSLGIVVASQLGDGLPGGSTDEDRFFGIQHDAGILRMTLTMPNSLDWEADHVQFSLAAPVPEPAALALMLIGLVATLAGYRRSASGEG